MTALSKAGPAFCDTISRLLANRNLVAWCTLKYYNIAHSNIKNALKREHWEFI